MLALLSLIPTKDFIYGSAIVALLAIFGAYTLHERRLGAAHEAAAVATASAKTQAAADAKIKALEDEYTAQLDIIVEKQSADIQAAADNSASLAARLRYYEANHCTHTVLPSAPASAPSGAAGPSGASGVEAAIEQLIAASEHDNAVIVAERAERDSLTGK